MFIYTRIYIYIYIYIYIFFFFSKTLWFGIPIMFTKSSVGGNLDGAHVAGAAHNFLGAGALVEADSLDGADALGAAHNLDDGVALGATCNIVVSSDGESDEDTLLDTDSDAGDVHLFDSAMVFQKEAPLHPLPACIGVRLRRKTAMKVVPFKPRTPLEAQAASAPMVPSKVNAQRDLAVSKGAPTGKAKGTAPRWKSPKLGVLTPTMTKDRSYIYARKDGKRDFILNVPLKWAKNHQVPLQNEGSII